MIILAVLFAPLREGFWADSNYWTLFGLVGNIMFTSRFVVQWYASEKLKQSIIPKNFWHLSLLGGLVQSGLRGPRPGSSRSSWVRFCRRSSPRAT